MRATKHAARQTLSRRGLVTGIPPAPLVAGAPSGRLPGSGSGARTTGIHGERPTVDGAAVQPGAAQSTRVRCARR
ncbi:hypothetical protein [Streptomyces griseorubiginosus]|uniref:hypothetical protein n=1 Tax=Streptomyces griseorubiginosus TaxID=67304 RepID=UPI0034060391